MPASERNPDTAPPQRPKRHGSSWLILFCLVAAGCPSPPSREEKAVVLLERMAAAFEKYGESDCDALAAELEAASGDEDALTALSEVDKTDASRRRLSKYQSRIDAATTSIVSHAKKCGAEPRVAHALAVVLGAG